MAAIPSWPVTFRVGLTTPGLWRGGGKLIVGPGRLTCIPGRVTGAVSAAHLVTHVGKRADIYIARLVPPWFNVSIPVRGQDGTLVASIWLPSRRRLRHVLRAAGFEVVEHVTWVYSGFRWSEMQPDTPPHGDNA